MTFETSTIHATLKQTVLVGIDTTISKDHHKCIYIYIPHGDKALKCSQRTPADVHLPARPKAEAIALFQMPKHSPQILSSLHVTSASYIIDLHSTVSRVWGARQLLTHPYAGSAPSGACLLRSGHCKSPSEIPSQTADKVVVAAFWKAKKPCL